VDRVKVNLRAKYQAQKVISIEFLSPIHTARPDKTVLSVSCLPRLPDHQTVFDRYVLCRLCVGRVGVRDRDAGSQAKPPDRPTAQTRDCSIMTIIVEITFCPLS